MTQTDAMIAAAREVLDLALEEMRQCIADAPTEALNWRPGGDDTNSIAVLAVHALSSTRSWLSAAVGAPLPSRDRDAEFAVKANDPGTLLAAFDGIAHDCVKLLEGAAPADWSAMRSTHPRPRTDAASQVTAAWALIHGLEHLREHEGQMFLTRQLWAEDRSVQSP